MVHEDDTLQLRPSRKAYRWPSARRQWTVGSLWPPPWLLSALGPGKMQQGWSTFLRVSLPFVVGTTTIIRNYPRRQIAGFCAKWRRLEMQQITKIAAVHHLSMISLWSKHLLEMWGTTKRAYKWQRPCTWRVHPPSNGTLQNKGQEPDAMSCQLFGGSQRPPALRCASVHS